MGRGRGGGEGTASRGPAAQPRAAPHRGGGERRLAWRHALEACVTRCCPGGHLMSEPPLCPPPPPPEISCRISHVRATRPRPRAALISEPPLCPGPAPSPRGKGPPCAQGLRAHQPPSPAPPRPAPPVGCVSGLCPVPTALPGQGLRVRVAPAQGPHTTRLKTGSGGRRSAADTLGRYSNDVVGPEPRRLSSMLWSSDMISTHCPPPVPPPVPPQCPPSASRSFQAPSRTSSPRTPPPQPSHPTPPTAPCPPADPARQAGRDKPPPGHMPSCRCRGLPSRGPWGTGDYGSAACRDRVPAGPRASPSIMCTASPTRARHAARHEARSRGVAGSRSSLADARACRPEPCAIL